MKCIVDTLFAIRKLHAKPNSSATNIVLLADEDHSRVKTQEVLDSHERLVTRTLLATKGIATRSKDATRGSWPHY